MTIVRLSALPEDHRDFDVSDERDVAALLRAEDRHFWHRTRNRIALDRLRAIGLPPGARIVDLGCGAGCVAAHLAGAGFAVTGVDGHARLLEAAERRCPSLRLWAHDLRLGTQSLPEHDFDAACLFDVVEHLDDPVRAVEDAARCVRPGALVVGTVPALMALWSRIDEHAGHKTRYSRALLAAMLARVRGARVVELSPFNRCLVPMLWLQRLVVGRRGDAASAARNLAVPPAPLNAALGALCLAEHRARAWLDRTPVGGASIWFAMRRQEEIRA